MLKIHPLCSTIAAFSILAVTLPIMSCGSSNDGQSESSLPQDSIVVEIAGVDSISVFQLTRKEHIVIYESSSLGVFVKAIDGIRNGNNHFWIYSVNDSAMNTASDKYIAKDGDIIKWHLRRIGQ